MSSEPVTLPLAFMAGLLSFLSPCVLPLVPAYLGYLGGTALLGGGQQGARSGTARLLVHALLFIAGFSAVFVTLGASATLLGRLLIDYRMVMARVGGVMLVVFGLRLMGEDWKRHGWLLAALGVAPLAFLASSAWVVNGTIGWDGLPGWLGDSAVLTLAVLAVAGWALPLRLALVLAAALVDFGVGYGTGQAELGPAVVEGLLIAAVLLLAGEVGLFSSTRRLDIRPTSQTGPIRSVLFGVAFAAGWTPCLGPILALILGLASQVGTLGKGISLLVAYSLGLGVPFLLVGLLLGPLGPHLRRLNRYARIVSLVSGALLALMGILFFTDSLSFLAQYGSLFSVKH